VLPVFFVFQDIAEALGKVVAVEEIASPLALTVLDVRLFVEHVVAVLDSWCRWNVTELTAVLAAGRDVDDVVAEALLVEFRLAEDRLRRVSVVGEPVLFLGRRLGRAFPAEKVAVEIGAEAGVDFLPTVGADEPRLPEIETFERVAVLAFGFAELIEGRILSEVLYDIVVSSDTVSSIKPAVVPLEFELHPRLTTRLWNIQPKKRSPTGVKVKVKP